MNRVTHTASFVRTALRIGVVAIAITALSGCIVIFGWDIARRANADLTIELTWKSNVNDLDLYVTYPGSQPVTSGDDPVYSSIQLAYDAPTLGEPGFFPEDGIGSRERVHAGNRTSSHGPGNVRWIANVGTRMEVIQVDAYPFSLPSLGHNTAANTHNALPAGFDYAWVGIMEVYVYGVSDPVVSAGSNAGATVTIYDRNANVLGEFVLPEQIPMQGASVARIALFERRSQSTGAKQAYYQILPHTTVIRDTGGIRSIAEPGDLVIGVETEE
ncbi:MAG: hypothetical protein EA382_09680 [Spirochaetaceae bacterium]|nr:MAG: hypothetical protein EA382_09680 [Spirochaetaceae bacterium]